ncbi:9226_t:CDS:2 [Funneliformis geosporum]|uniref:6109_t:CDS:1 n=1 Tax=Funneliformis geosporum TaxID=1117311 RepID=A0A9W4WSI7_9GLOM|nr:9226_t:CDS:2 [Funneliformis geosporum]CAI2183730.1 6109_t:CDS:2 [Funneliformis geosporum]
MDISSNSDDSFENEEAIDILFRSYSSTPVVHIADISNATPRQFFERFIPVDFIISVVIPSTNKYARECEQTARVSLAFGQYILYQRFRNIIKYLTLTDISTNNDPFHFAWQFHDEFNENLIKAILPGPYLCMDESIGRTIIADSWFDSTDACITLYKHGLYSILQIKKHRYWPKNIPNDITDVFENTYGLSISRVCKISDVDLTVYSIHDHKDIVLFASYSTTTLRREVNRYIKGYGNATFHRPIVFDEYNEFRSAVNMFNNLRDNSLSYHDILGLKRSADHVFCFILQLQRQIASLHIVDLFQEKKYETR